MTIEGLTLQGSTGFICGFGNGGGRRKKAVFERKRASAEDEPEFRSFPARSAPSSL